MRSYSFIDSLDNYLELLEKRQLTSNQKVIRISQLYRYVITHVTDSYNIQFTSIFSRLSFLVSALSLSGQDSYLLHTFRKITTTEESEIRLGLYCVRLLAYSSYKVDHNFDKERKELINQFEQKSSEVKKFIPELRVLIKSIDINQKVIYAQKTDEPFDDILVDFNVAERNEDFSPLLIQLKENAELPVFCNLINVELDNSGRYAPESFVFEPDYLYDVTSISECFGAFSSNEIGFILRKFIGISSSPPLIIGNIANHFLDQLIYNAELTFEEALQSIFQIDALGLTILEDNKIREMIGLLKQHFSSLKKVVNEDFIKVNISDKESFIEPSFYSTKYGIQGRLDLFSLRADAASIVELKSGSPFKTNTYGLSNNHYHQTLLYDMLIESVYGYQLKRNNFILYSKESHNQLRYAPNIKSQRRETIKFRNKLFLLDQRLRSAPNFLEILNEFAEIYQKKVKGFQQRDLSALLEAFNSLDNVELNYTEGLIHFILKEQRLSKLGDDAKERLSGLASLWRDDLELKIEQFNIINHLTISDNKSLDSDPTIVLHRTELTAQLSNFRVGDMGIFYADQGVKDNILRDQVFKCTLLEVSSSRVVIRLRSRQENPKIFDRHKYWSIEHDVLDNSFNTMTRSIFEFAKSSKAHRERMLGITAPEIDMMFDPIEWVDEMTAEQNEVYQKVIRAKEYFLLWGPPGTGKTSILLKNLSRYYLKKTNQRILLLAYTNRAVDEICGALNAIDDKLDFIRIGSRYSTSERYQKNLLTEKTKSKTTRAEVHNLLSSQQVYVGTVASTLGKGVLFDLIDFDLVIIDEASQILDAQLIGLLSRFKKFVLIGDHKQLPAVVLQDYKKTAVEDEELVSLGITNWSNSLFERMYRRSEEKGWTQSFGLLSYQGRMHEQLMDFPNHQFYNSNLKTLDKLSRLTAHPEYSKHKTINERMIFVPSSIDMLSDSIKVNINEAKICVELVKRILQDYKELNLPLDQKSIGIITPYRAQIACIIDQLRKELPESQVDIISVDTVERYQGGARDRIIMSTCLNFSFQMEGITSISEEGIDRKLNVAFTRAKEQFILVGNQDILLQNEVYSDLISRSSIVSIDP